MLELLLLFVVTAALAVAMGPRLLRSLSDAGATVTNYRGEALACPLGLVLPAAVLVAFVPLALLEMAGVDGVLRADGLAFVLGAAVLGLADDAYSGPSRGWRGHFAAVRDGRFSTGALKAVGIAGLALYVTSAPDDVDRWILGALVLVLATNLFNLLDLRPGRAVKGYLLVAAACAIAAWDESVATGLAAYTGAIVAAGLFDLREQGMMGDTGSNAIGAVAGLWLIATIDSTGGLAACVAVLATLTAYGEFRSISAFIERTPVFRHLDSLGRVNRA